MAADFRAVMQSVYDFFLQTYNSASPGTPAGTFLAFEKIGHPVFPADFKLKPDDTDFSPVMARERTSQLGNAIPQVASNFVTPTDRLVDDTYSMLLIGSTPTGSQDEITFLANLKAEANKRFIDTELESLLGMSKYHPCDAAPVDWYDPSKTAGWPTFSKKAGPTTTEGPAPAHPVQFNPAWTLQPAAADVNNILTKRAVLAPVASPVSPVASPVKPVMMAHPAIAASRFVVSPAAATTLAAAHPALDLAVAPAAPPQIAILTPRVALPLRAVLLRDLVNTAPQKPVNSDQFSISFSYCLVRLSRQWLYQPFLDCKSWYVPGYKEGDFSTGTEEANSGTFAALPLAFLLIKDLSIVANWTEDDAAAAKNSLALPPFSLVGSAFQSNTLSCQGMQIIAWICQPMPLLPPQSAPAGPGN